MDKTFDSGDDRRTQGNDTRINYRELSDLEKDQMQRLKIKQQEFIGLCNAIGKSRELSIAITNAEQAAMWAVKHVTGPKS